MFWTFAVISSWKIIRTPQNFVEGSFSIKSVKIRKKERVQILPSRLIWDYPDIVTSGFPKLVSEERRPKKISGKTFFQTFFSKL